MILVCFGSLIFHFPSLKFLWSFPNSKSIPKVLVFFFGIGPTPLSNPLFLFRFRILVAVFDFQFLLLSSQTLKFWVWLGHVPYQFVLESRVVCVCFLVFLHQDQTKFTKVSPKLPTINVPKILRQYSCRLFLTSIFQSSLTAPVQVAWFFPGIQFAGFDSY